MNPETHAGSFHNPTHMVSKKLVTCRAARETYIFSVLLLGLLDS
jgi:hypothetical protein